VTPIWRPIRPDLRSLATAILRRGRLVTDDYCGLATKMLTCLSGLHIIALADPMWQRAGVELVKLL
jgi:hypothetical protein